MASSLLIACQSQPSQEEATPLPVTATPHLPIEQDLREAYQEPDLNLRRDRILEVSGRFLISEAIQDTEDNVAATYYSNIAFWDVSSTGRGGQFR